MNKRAMKKIRQVSKRIAEQEILPQLKAFINSLTQEERDKIAELIKQGRW